MSECKHGLDPAWCLLCLRGLPKPAERATVEATFLARYEGQCPVCNLPIRKGEVVHRMSNESYVHQGCE